MKEWKRTLFKIKISYLKSKSSFWLGDSNVELIIIN